MTDRRVAHRYALALFGAAKKQGIVDAVEADLRLVDAVLANDERNYDFVVAPFTTRAEKIAILDRSFGDRVTALTHQVMRVMIEKQRESDLPLLGAEFTDIRRRDAGVVAAKVTSAEPLDAIQRDLLVANLRTRLARTVEAEFAVDPSLVGGFTVAYDNFILDGSVKGALGQLREKLRIDALKTN